MNNAAQMTAANAKPFINQLAATTTTALNAVWQQLNQTNRLVSVGEMSKYVDGL